MRPLYEPAFSRIYLIVPDWFQLQIHGVHRQVPNRRGISKRWNHAFMELEPPQSGPGASRDARLPSRPPTETTENKFRVDFPMCWIAAWDDAGCESSV